jgi:hypothetical protein
LKEFSIFCFQNIFVLNLDFFLNWNSTKVGQVPDSSPEGWADRDSELKVAVKEVEIKVTDIDSSNLWDDYTSGQ